MLVTPRHTSTRADVGFGHFAASGSGALASRVGREELQRPAFGSPPREAVPLPDSFFNGPNDLRWRESERMEPVG
jgi:hypothetical protein